MEMVLWDFAGKSSFRVVVQMVVMVGMGVA